MLSAVAARKARLAHPQTPLPSTPSTPSASSPLPSPEPRNKPSTQKPPSKRKTNAFAGNATKKRRTQTSKVVPERTARYFSQPDAFKTQDDVIVVEATENETSAISPDTPSEDEAPHIPNYQPNSRLARKQACSSTAPLLDSSDGEGDTTLDEQLTLDIPLPLGGDRALVEPPSTLSTFQPVFNQNVFFLPHSDTDIGESSPKRTALLLAESDTVALLGTYSISVLQGTISLAGVSFTAPSTSPSIFAPRSAPLPIIRCLPPSSSTPSVLQNLPSDLRNAAKSYDAVIILQELHTGIEGLGKICRTFDGFFAPSRWHRHQTKFDLGLDTVYFLANQTPDVFPLDVPPSWDSAIGGICSPSTSEHNTTPQRSAYLVRGPKNTGKSSFARLMLNRLLAKFQRVAYLECDLGQSEFTPGGMVSLNVVEQPIFGPPFSHPSIPHAAHYIGATSPKTTPSHYLDSIQTLVQLYDLDVQNGDLDEPNSKDGRISSVVPLIVNTMGWTKGLGADLTRKIEEIVEASHIFSFDASADECDPSAQIHPCQSTSGLPGPQVCPVESVEPSASPTYYSAADHRNLALLSYFHANFLNHPHTPTSPIATSWATTLPLCAQHPYEVDVPATFDQLFVTGAGAEDVVPAEVHRALPCAVVGLVSCQPGTLGNDMPVDPDDAVSISPFYDQGAPPPSPYTSNCIGLAIVRAISPTSPSRMQLLTPVPPHLLGSARALVLGELQLPVWGMLDFRTLDDCGDVAGCERGKVPYLRWGKGEGAGGERRRVRRNLMRRGQM